MNKIFPCLYFAFLCTICFSNCRKPEENLSVTATSAELQKDGSVIFKATIQGDNLDYGKSGGICIDTNDLPTKSGYYKYMFTTDGKFEMRFKNLLPYKTYYFRPFVDHDNGYVYGNVISVVHPKFDFSSIGCQLPLDSVFMTSSSGSTISNIIHELFSLSYGGSENEWSVTASFYGSYNRVRAEFRDLPVQGEYTTRQYFTSKADTNIKYIQIYVNDIAVKDGTKAYLEVLDEKNYELRFCDAVFNEGPYEYNISTKFRFSKRD